MADKIIINLTDAAPVRIIEDEWPIIAVGSAGAVETGGTRVEITVRQHCDGRAIVSGFLSHSSRSSVSRIHSGGIVYDPSRGSYSNGVSGVINIVARSLGDRASKASSDSGDYCRAAAVSCINDLPPIDL